MAATASRSQVDTESFYSGYVDDSLDPIDRLNYQSNAAHTEWVLDQLLKRIRASEKEMQKFHARWRVAERKVQAYMSLPKYEQILKDMNNAGKPPAPALIVFPYQYAVISTIVTHMARVFCGRKPIFQLGVTSSGSAELVRNMETMLQYQADYTKMVVRLYQFFTDGELYGLAVMRNTWTEKTAKRTIWQQPTPALIAVGGAGPQRQSVEKKIYAGAEVENIDPFLFLPDPNVPMAEVNTKGEFVGWREFVGKHILQAEERAGRLKYVNNVEQISGEDSQYFDLSNRNLLSNGDSHAGAGKANASNTYMLDQMSILIIPDDWGLGEETYPCRFLFSILNKSRIIQAVRLEDDHDAHPVVVCEPYTQGYGFGNPSLTDYLGPIQDIMSWFIDSHIQNVRAVLNDQLIVDPSRVEMADVKRPGPGRIIRLKATAIGQDVKTAISQLPIQDVTRGHMTDLQIFQRIGDTVSAVNDNLRGVNVPGGRRSATESRISGEAGASRLASHAQQYSSQAIQELARQMTLNTQQYMEDEIFLKVLGADEAVKMTPQGLMGDFVFPVHDGSLPIDKTAALEQWKEIFLAVQSDQELRQSYSLPRIFDFIAEMGGAVNIQSFKIQGGEGGPTGMGPELPPDMAPLSDLPLPTRSATPQRPIPRMPVGVPRAA